MRTYTFYYTLNGESDLKIYYFRAPSLSGAIDSLCLLLDNYGDNLQSFEHYYRVSSCDKNHVRRLPLRYFQRLSQYVLEFDDEIHS